MWTWRGILLSTLFTLGLAAPAQAVSLLEARAEAHSPDGRCAVTVLYPQLRGLDAPAREGAINGALRRRFRGPGDQELHRADGECLTAYLASIGFEAQLFPAGVLSLKKTHAVVRGDGFAGGIEQECQLIDLRRGGRLEPASLLGPVALAKLSSVAQAALQQRFAVHDLRRAGFRMSSLKLARGNFSLCLDGKQLLVQLSPNLVDPDERGAVEVRIQPASLAGSYETSPLAALLARP